MPEVAKLKRIHATRELPDLDALPRTALLTRAQVCGLSNFSLPTLKMWAVAGRGPKLTVVEGRPRYAAGDVQAWLFGQTSQSEAA